MKKTIINFVLFFVLFICFTGCSANKSISEEIINENIQGLWKSKDNDSEMLYAFDDNEMYIYESMVSGMLFVNSYEYIIEEGKVSSLYRIDCDYIEDDFCLKIGEQIYIKATEIEYGEEIEKASYYNSISTFSYLKKFILIDYPDSSLIQTIEKGIISIFDTYTLFLDVVTEKKLESLYFDGTSDVFYEKNMTKLYPDFTNNACYVSSKLHLDMDNSNIILDCDILSDGAMGGVIYEVIFDSEDTTFNVGGTGLSGKYSQGYINSTKTSHSYVKDIILSDDEFENLKRFLVSSNQKIIFSMWDTSGGNIIEFSLTSECLDIYRNICFLYETKCYLDFTNVN